MNVKHYLYTGMVAVMTVVAPAACTEDIVTDSSMPGALKIQVADAALGDTRTTYAGFTTSFESGDQIGLYAVDGSSVVTDNACYTYDGSGWSTSATVEYNTGYTYYAYYPYVESPYTPDFTQSGVDDKFALFITDGSNMFHQQDQSAKANFQASDLMIAQGEDEGSNTISFAMLHKKGLAVFDGDDVLDATFSGSNKPYTHSSKRFFLMKPSTSTEFTDDEGTYSLSASSGKYVTHGVSVYTDYVLTVTGLSEPEYYASTSRYSVTSYKQNSTGTKKKAVAWTASYDTDDDEEFDDSKPSWLSTFTASGNGGTKATNYTLSISDRYRYNSSNTYAQDLLSLLTVPMGSSDNYYDLSTGKYENNNDPTDMSTANCYIIDHAGYYMLPLVYGNAIKDGADNTTAYAPDISESLALTPFINHAGDDITGPWITKSGDGVDAGMGINVNGAQVIWQDVDDLVTDCTIDGDYLKFRVSDNNSEGNAVIAVMSGSTIVWSWHIWMSVGFDDRYYIPIGWVNDTESMIWVSSATEDLSCKVKITQTGSAGLSQVFAINHYGSVSCDRGKRGYAPYYQWGRKDPFVPAIANYENSTTDRTVYVGSGIPSKGYEVSSTTMTFQNNIKYPWRLYTNGLSDTYNNLWDGETVTYDVTGMPLKTVYDPCPDGFHIPRAGTYQAIEDDIYKNSNGSWNDTNKVFEYNMNYFPALGFRSESTNNNLNGISTDLNYWSANAGSTYPLPAAFIYQQPTNHWAKREYPERGYTVIMERDE